VPSRGAADGSCISSCQRYCICAGNWHGHQNPPVAWKAPAELCALLNELTTLQSLANQLDGRHLDKAGDGLEHLLLYLTATVAELNSLKNRFIDSSKGLNKHGQHRKPAVSWRIERDNMHRLLKKARQTREYLNASLTSLSASERWA
jgi:hypothetical protein